MKIIKSISSVVFSVMILTATSTAGAEPAWTNVGPPGASVSQVVFDQASPDTLFLGTRDRGLYRSDDGGSTYTNVTAGLPGEMITALAQDPLSGTIWAGVAQVGHAGGDLYRSADGGATWQAVALPPPAGQIVALQFAPSAPSRLWVATDFGGLFLSDDSGATFTVRSFDSSVYPLVATLAVDPTDADRIYVGMMPSVVRSDDAGATFVALTDSPSDVTALAVNPSNPSVLFAGGLSGVWRSGDEGSSWTPVWDSLGDARNTALRFDGAGATLYAGTRSHGVFVSTSNGLTWQPHNEGVLDGRINVLVKGPGSVSEVWVGADRGGLFSTAGSSAAWTQRTGDLNHSDVRALAEGGDGRIWAGTMGGAVYRMEPESSEFELVAVPDPHNAPIYDLAVDPQHPGVLYAATQQGLYKSSDGGGSWWPLIADGLSSRAVVVDPLDSSTVYVGSENHGAYQSSDSGATWTPLALGSTGSSVRDIVIDVHDRATLYVATFGEGMLRSTDGGASFAAASAGMESPYLYDLHQHAGGRLYAATSSGAYHSDDGGSSWTLLAGSWVVTSADTLVVDPDDPDTLYLGLLYGTVARSVDGGATFTPFEAGYAGSRTTRLLFTADRRLLAATTDNGAFEVVTEAPGPMALAIDSLVLPLREPPPLTDAQDPPSQGCNQAPAGGALPVWILALSLLLLFGAWRSRRSGRLDRQRVGPGDRRAP